MVSMPLCCCSFRSMGKCCSPLSEGDRPAQAHAETDEPANEHAHCHGGHCHSDTPADTHSDAPRDDDGERCACGKSLTKTGLVEKPAIEIPAPTLVAILPFVAESGWLVKCPQCAMVLSAEPDVGPATSLLRQHCALIV
jgi:hypothetical protein